MSVKGGNQAKPQGKSTPKNQVWGLNLYSKTTQDVALGVTESRTSPVIATFVLNHLPQSQNECKNNNNTITNEIFSDSWSATMAIKFDEIEGFDVKCFYVSFFFYLFLSCIHKT